LKNIEVWVVKDPQGDIWQTPKGKSSWGSSSAAKNAWSCHTWLDNGPNPYNKNLRSIKQGKWSKDAIGWTTELIMEYKVSTL